MYKIYYKLIFLLYTCVHDFAFFYSYVDHQETRKIFQITLEDTWFDVRVKQKKSDKLKRSEGWSNYNHQLYTPTEYTNSDIVQKIRAEQVSWAGHVENMETNLAASNQVATKYCFNYT